MTDNTYFHAFSHTVVLNFLEIYSRLLLQTKTPGYQNNSRFRRLHLPKYRRQQFLDVAVKVCPKLSEETATMIGEEVWKAKGDSRPSLHELSVSYTIVTATVLATDTARHLKPSDSSSFLTNRVVGLI